MKKPIIIICVMLVLLTLTPAISAAAEAEPEAIGGIYAVVTDISGASSVENAETAQISEDDESYTLMVDGESVLKVDHITGNPAASTGSSYYTADFVMPDDGTEIFLTGLSAERAEEIRQTVAAGYTRSQSFSLEDIDFIDCEKTFDSGDGDDNLCWAAASANILTYTGWAAQAGFENEDDLFEALISAFDDDGSHPIYALAWFFNGAAVGDNSGRRHAKIMDYPSSGGYMTDYAFDSLCEMNYFYGVSDMADCIARLREGCGVSLGLDLYTPQGEYGGGHSVTMWGYAADDSLPEDDPSRYITVFITDSDSDELSDSDRRDSPDVLSAYPVTMGGDGLYSFFYEDGWEGVLGDYLYLLPFDENAPAETESAATRNKISDPDLAYNSLFLYESSAEQGLSTLFESGCGLSFRSKVINNADVSYSGVVYQQVTLTSSDGDTLFNSTKSYGINLAGNYIVTLAVQTVSDLAEGDYTLTFALNPNRTATEAYFCNNSSSIGFKVRDSYLLGDYDGNSELSIMDATKLQRKLADYYVEVDERASERGDCNGNGLDITDATLIQRRIADYITSQPVGEKQLYR